MSLVDPTLHFLELSPKARPLLTNSSKWSFSGRLGSPEMDSFSDLQWSPLGTENGLILGPQMDSFGNPK